MFQDRGYKIVVLNFRNPNLGNAWNPLTLPYRLYKEGNVDKASELIDDVASNIIKDKKSQDPFWENSAADYFAGCALGLMEDGTEEECNINSINYMTTVGEEKIGSKTFIQEYFTMKGENSNAYVFASNTINSPNETKGGILAVFRSKIRLFASREQLSEMLSHSDFDMESIGKEPTAVFIKRFTFICDSDTKFMGRSFFVSFKALFILLINSWIFFPSLVDISILSIDLLLSKYSLISKLDIVLILS